MNSIGFPDKGSPLFRNLYKRGTSMKYPSAGTAGKHKANLATNEKRQDGCIHSTRGYRYSAGYDSGEMHRHLGPWRAKIRDCCIFEIL
jgi:hypothetical protein